jgi:hypothetical protein
LIGANITQVLENIRTKGPGRRPRRERICQNKRKISTSRLLGISNIWNVEKQMPDGKIVGGRKESVVFGFWCLVIGSGSKIRGRDRTRRLFLLFFLFVLFLRGRGRL